MDISCVRVPDAVRIFTEEKMAVMDIVNDTCKYKDVKVTFCPLMDGMKVNLEAGRSELRFIVLRWNGEWKRRYRFLGDAFERGYGNLEWRGLCSERIMPWYFSASDGENSLAYGVKVRPNALCFWMCDSQGITLWLDVRAGGAGVILGDRKLELAQVVEKESGGQSAFRFLQDFCRCMCNDPLLPKEPVYGSNNWYYAYGNSSREDILRDTGLIAKLTQGIKNRPYMVIDDCWQELALVDHAAGRPYERGNVRFPDMKGIAQDMKSMNVHPGIWIRPLKSSERFIDRSLFSIRDKGILDPSRKEVLDMVAEDVERIAGWGYELIKFDFVTRDIFAGWYPESLPLLKEEGWSFRNRDKTAAERIKDLYNTIKLHSNGAVLLGCNTIGHLAAGYIHVHRSGDDTSGKNYDRSIMMGVNSLAFRLVQNNAFFNIDADCIGITDKIPWEDSRKLLRLFKESGTPLFISADPKCMKPQIEEELQKTFQTASKQSCDMEPVDWMDTTLPQKYLVDGKKLSFKWHRSFGLESFTSV